MVTILVYNMLMKNYLDIFLQILSIIGYSGDRIAHTNEFLALCSDKAITVFLDSLPEREREKVRIDILSQPQTLENITITLSKNIYPEEYQRIFADQAIGALKQYLLDVVPVLSKSQVNNLRLYLASLGKSFEDL